MIKIGKPYVERKENKVKIINDILIDNQIKSIWFEVDEEYEKYLSCDRSDAYVIGLLHYALKNNHNIECELPVSEELLYNIRTILIPSLVKHSKNFFKIDIEAQPVSNYEKGRCIGTGCSCGIDSMSAIFNHLNTKYTNMDLTHLCINNVGAFNDCYKDYGKEKVKDERYEKTEQVASEIGLPLVKTDSNFGEVIPQIHLYTHTYSSMFAVYMLEKMWGVYYYASSGIDYSGFSLKNNDIQDCAHYELLSLQCFSQSNIRIYSEGGEKTRLDKTRDVVNFDIANKHLHVCLNKPYNCNVCSKCRRTLVTLDLLNKLDNFKDVFDIEYYQNNKKDYYRWLAHQHYKKDEMNEPVYQYFKKKSEYKNAVRFSKYKYMMIENLKSILPEGMITRIKSLVKGKR